MLDLLKKIYHRRRQLPGMVLIANGTDSSGRANAKTAAYFSQNQKHFIHLGCGDKHLSKWLNIDIGGKADLFWDLTKPMDFLAENSFDGCYSEHVLEHFERKVGVEICRSIFKALKHGGVFRIAIPDLDLVIQRYVQGYDAKEYVSTHDGFKNHYGEVFYTKGELVDICFRGWGHRYLYNLEDLSLILKSVGFTNVQRVAYKTSRFSFFENIETRPADQSALIVEAIK